MAIWCEGARCLGPPRVICLCWAPRVICLWGDGRVGWAWAGPSLLTIIIITSKRCESKPKPVLSYQPRAPLVSCLPSGLSVGCSWAAQRGPPVRRVREELRWASSFWFILGPGPSPAKTNYSWSPAKTNYYEKSSGKFHGPATGGATSCLESALAVPRLRLAEGPFSTAPPPFSPPTARASTPNPPIPTAHRGHTCTRGFNPKRIRPG